jgi:hypothetical protein
LADRLGVICKGRLRIVQLHEKRAGYNRPFSYEPFAPVESV